MTHLEEGNWGEFEQEPTMKAARLLRVMEKRIGHTEMISRVGG